jgi:hypothetical protein
VPRCSIHSIFKVVFKIKSVVPFNTSRCGKAIGGILDLGTRQFTVAGGIIIVEALFWNLVFNFVRYAESVTHRRDRRSLSVIHGLEYLFFGFSFGFSRHWHLVGKPVEAESHTHVRNSTHALAQTLSFPNTAAPWIIDCSVCS